MNVPPCPVSPFRQFALDGFSFTAVIYSHQQSPPTGRCAHHCRLSLLDSSPLRRLGVRTPSGIWLPAVVGAGIEPATYGSLIRRSLLHERELVEILQHQRNVFLELY